MAIYGLTTTEPIRVTRGDWVVLSHGDRQWWAVVTGRTVTATEGHDPAQLPHLELEVLLEAPTDGSAPVAGLPPADSAVRRATPAEVEGLHLTVRPLVAGTVGKEASTLPASEAAVWGRGPHGPVITALTGRQWALVSA